MLRKEQDSTLDHPTRPAASGRDRTKLAPDQPVDRVVLGSALALCLGFVAWGVVDADSLASSAQAVLDRILHSTGWLYGLVTSGLVVFALFLAFSRFGDIRLGRDGERPEFSTPAWTAMLFASGMGIGLVFWGVAEPLSHLARPPMGAAAPNSPEASRLAMEYSVFHWGLHPWSLYALVGLALAYGMFRKGRPNLLSAIVLPGRPSSSGPSRAIDAFVVFLTTFGAATSLGLGALQINSGLASTFGVPENTAVAIAVIAGLMLLFVLSAVTGVHRGIKHISTVNAALAGVLVAFVFVAGPSVRILQTLIETLGGYTAHIVPMSSQTGAYGGEAWLAAWTVFYWAWWMSWAPFVGAFIARISRGRTVRAFVVGVLVVPTALSLAWFAVMGGTGIHLQLTGQAPIADVLEASGEEGALFSLFGHLPLTTLSSVAVMVLIALFFVSSADSASVVLAMMCQRGALHPRRSLVVLWGVAIALTAAVLLLAGGLSAIQTVSLVVALPFMALLVAACVGLLRELRAEPVPEPGRPRAGVR
ncbi:BCCT family transporter [Nocardiopsis halophila]|uniref:BCCT family transporter n=1 Tax=Nocardiopsis halophila TaxID=141692 RepID=UPI0003453C27|nr:BCCT family transporter [Nocardiopsis halophila]